MYILVRAHHILPLREKKILTATVPFLFIASKNLKVSVNGDPILGRTSMSLLRLAF